jgi:hypothetical protein
MDAYEPDRSDALERLQREEIDAETYLEETDEDLRDTLAEQVIAVREIGRRRREAERLVQENDRRGSGGREPEAV